MRVSRILQLSSRWCSTESQRREGKKSTTDSESLNHMWIPWKHRLFSILSLSSLLIWCKNKIYIKNIYKKHEITVKSFEGDFSLFFLKFELRFVHFFAPCRSAIYSMAKIPSFSGQAVYMATSKKKLCSREGAKDIAAEKRKTRKKEEK